jgi:hypothetical protein
VLSALSSALNSQKEVPNGAITKENYLTADEPLHRRIQHQPLLEWKALNVRRHRGLP